MIDQNLKIEYLKRLMFDSYKKKGVTSIIVSCPRKKLLFFSYTLKWYAILFYINKASCIFIPFHPLFCFGIKNLRTISHCTIAMSVS